MAEYRSKKVTVKAPRAVVFAKASDMDGFFNAVPEQYRGDITIGNGVLRVSYAGVTIAIRQSESIPCDKVSYTDVESPFHFTVSLLMSDAEEPAHTCLEIVMDADLNFMMRSLLGSRIQEFLDKIALSVAAGGPIA